MQHQERYIIYVRKSTDVEDKQVLSVEAQIVELKKYAKDNGLFIVDTVVEKKSAKKPGRKKFNNTMRRVESGEANGILSWHPDRLARNSVDGGHIIYLLDEMLLVSLKFPTFWFENTSQGKFMLSMAFTQSKYYVDSLSENTKRGLRQKVRNGDYPGLAPIGYINDVRTKSVVVDKWRAPLVVEVFERYVKGDKRLEDIAIFLASKGVRTSGNKLIPKEQVKYMLQNPFYYGHFRYMGEIHNGNHKPIIEKRLYDRVQAVLTHRGYTRKPKNEPQALCGLIRCGECGMAITAEKKIKKQKNGNVHEYVYYRCSRKNKAVRCTDPPLRDHELVPQLSDILQSYALPADWATELEAMIVADEKQAERTSGAFIADAQNKIGNLGDKLQRLLDSYLDQDIDQNVYRAKQAELMSEKKSLEEQVGKLTLAANAWVEPMREWLKLAVSLKKIAKSGDLVALKEAFRQIEGLNLFLENKKVRLSPHPISHLPPADLWVWLRQSLEKTARMGGISGKNPNLAEKEGFEPSVRFTARRFSRPVPSTTRSPLHIFL
jgi:site-specific DNA recombinase